MADTHQSDRGWLRSHWIASFHDSHLSLKLGSELSIPSVEGSPRLKNEEIFANLDVSDLYWEFEIVYR